MFFDNLKEACLKKGTSPTALLRSLGMSTSSVTSWKKGVEPSMGTIYRLAEKLDIEPASLLDAKDQSVYEAYEEGYMGRLLESQKEKVLTQEDEHEIENGAPDENYIILARNAKKLSPENRKQLLDMARIMFKEEFKD